MLDFTIDRIPFEVVVAQQRLVDELYQQGTQMQAQGIQNTQEAPSQMQEAGGSQ